MRCEQLVARFALLQVLRSVGGRFCRKSWSRMAVGANTKSMPRLCCCRSLPSERRLARGQTAAG